jgi:hypothetical protein
MFGMLKHDHRWWSAHLTGLVFAAAGVVYLWMLLKDWARLVVR